MTLLQLEQVTKRFGPRTAVAGVSLSIAPGQVVGLLGPNGAGKSTLLSMIAGLVEPDAGSIRIAGQPAVAWPRTKLGVVGQHVAVYQELTVRENLAFFAALYGLTGEARRVAVEREMRALGLEDRDRSVARDLSGGLLRRLHIAIALLHEPPLLILDEPSAGLDVESRSQVWSLLRGLRSSGRTLLLTTHHLDEAEELCDVLAILVAGRLLRVSTPEALRAELGAAEIVHVQATELERVVQIAADRHYVTRRHEDGIDVRLPKALELRELAELFDGAGVTMLSRRPVRLQDAYLELCRAEGAALPRDAGLTSSA